jgi:hypothetical protein
VSGLQRIWRAATGPLLLALVAGLASAQGRTLAVSTVTVEVIGRGTVTSSPSGLGCGGGQTACSLAFSGGGTVTLTATPASGWSFDSWNDCPSGPSGTCEIPVDGSDQTVTANFSGPPTSTSTLSATYTGSGSLRGGSIDCGSAPQGSACTWTALTGSTLTVRQTPAPDSIFTGWGGSCAGTGVVCTTVVDIDRSVSAAWTASTGVILTVSVSAGGTVSGAGIDCPSTCTATEALNSTVLLTAAPAQDHVFTGWDGACSGSATTCAVLMSEAMSVSAKFAPVAELEVAVTGAGNVTGASGAINCGKDASLCSARLGRDTSVTLTAAPAKGAAFTGWSGACGGSETTCTVIMSDSRSVSAAFQTAQTPLTVTVSGPGKVTGGGINCGSSGTICTANPAPDATVTLTATGSLGTTFGGWSGACAGTTTACTVAMNGTAKTVGASFTTAASTVPLTVSVSGRGGVSGGGISCGNGATLCAANPSTGSSVVLTAAAAAGETFKGWTGACSGTTTTCTLTMSAAKTVAAAFSGAPATHTKTLTVKVSGPGAVSSSAGTCTSTGPTRRCGQAAAANGIVLVATPAIGARFTGWGGACIGTKTSCTVTLSGQTTVMAAFSATRAKTSSVLTRLGPARVRGTAAGFRVTLRFRTTRAGTARVHVLRSGHRLRTGVRRVSAGAVVLGPFALQKPGSYAFDVTLGRSTLHWRTCLGRRC